MAANNFPSVVIVTQIRDQFDSLDIHHMEKLKER